MSGIACILNFEDKIKSSLEDAEVIEQSLRFRGKDRSNLLFENNILMVQTMFEVTEEDKFECLPLDSKENKLLLVSDTRIDNRDDLIKKLKLNKKVITDSELIIESYKKWKENLAKEIIGAFSFIIYDYDRKILLAFRDQMGLKPLFYKKEDSRIIFSSSISTFEKLSEEGLRLNKRRIEDYLLFSSGRPKDTFYKEIKKLSKGTLIKIENSKLSSKRYYQLKEQEKLNLKNDDEYAQEFRKLFEKVIKSQLRSPNLMYASALSGGLDSTSITRTLSHINKHNKNKVHSISILFEGLSKEEKNKADEEYFMKKAEERESFESHYVRLKETGPISNLKIFQSYFHYPIASINGYIHEAMFKRTKEIGSRVFFDGFDGDTVVSHGTEKLFEYAKKFNFVRLIREKREIDSIFGYRSSISSILKTYFIKPKVPSIIDFYFRALFRKEIYPINIFNILNKNKKRRIINKYKYINSFYGIYPYQYLGSPIKQHIFSIEQPIWEYGIEQIENHALRHEVEVRFPFFDLRIIEFCISLPSTQKNKFGINRYILRNAMKGIVPEEILQRYGKANIGAFAEREIKKYDFDKLLKDIESDSELSRLVDLDNIKNNIIKNITNDNFHRSNDLLRAYLLISLISWLKK